MSHELLICPVCMYHNKTQGICACCGEAESLIYRTEPNNEQLVVALKATVRWNMPDGPCWCELKRANVAKIHSQACKLARAALKTATDSES